MEGSPGQELTKQSQVRLSGERAPNAVTPVEGIQFLSFIIKANWPHAETQYIERTVRIGYPK